MQHQLPSASRKWSKEVSQRIKTKHGEFKAQWLSQLKASVSLKWSLKSLLRYLEFSSKLTFQFSNKLKNLLSSFYLRPNSNRQLCYTQVDHHKVYHFMWLRNLLFHHNLKQIRNWLCANYSHLKCFSYSSRILNLPNQSKWSILWSIQMNSFNGSLKVVKLGLSPVKRQHLVLIISKLAVLRRKEKLLLIIEIVLL